MPADVEAVKVEIKRQTNTVNQATETDTQLCEDINKSSEDLNIPQPTCETSEKIQDAPTETSNVPNDFPSNEIKPCDAVEEKSLTKTTLAGFVGTALLVSSVVYQCIS